MYGNKSCTVCCKARKSTVIGEVKNVASISTSEATLMRNFNTISVCSNLIGSYEDLYIFIGVIWNLC